jgi:peptide/nickel transport system substrate-binding protein
MDNSVRAAMYRQASAILCDQAPWAFAYNGHEFFVRQPYVRGFKPHPVWGLDASHVWLDKTAGALGRVLRGGLP